MPLDSQRHALDRLWITGFRQAGMDVSLAVCRRRLIEVADRVVHEL